MNHNPYQSPSVESPLAFEGAVRAQTIDLLARTQPWVRFISIVGLLFTCLMFIGLFFSAVSVGAFASHSGQSSGLGVAALLPAIVVMVLYVYPLIKLSAYAAAIRRLKASGSVADLNHALNQQRAFWKFVGMLMLIGIILWVLFFAVGMGGAFLNLRWR